MVRRTVSTSGSSGTDMILAESRLPAQTQDKYRLAHQWLLKKQRLIPSCPEPFPLLFGRGKGWDGGPEILPNH